MNWETFRVVRLDKTDPIFRLLYVFISILIFISSSNKAVFRAGSRMLLRLLVIGSIGVVSKEVESTELFKEPQIVECFPFSLYYKLR